MISAATLENYQPYRRNNIATWLLMLANGASIYFRGAPLIDEYLMILTVVVVGWASIFHQVYYTIEDFKRVLNI